MDQDFELVHRSQAIRQGIERAQYEQRRSQENQRAALEAALVDGFRSAYHAHPDAFAPFAIDFGQLAAQIAAAVPLK